MGYRVDAYDPYGSVLEEEALADGNYLLRHWRGQLPLAQSYWLNSFLANFALTIVGLTLKSMGATSIDLAYFAVAFLFYVLLVYAASIWSIVGVWRSAGRHPARGGSPAWGFIARGMTIFSTLALFAATPGLWAQSREFALIAVGRDPIGDPAKLTLVDGGKRMLLRGAITAGTAHRFEKAIANAGSLRTVELQSPGGRIAEALRMAEIIKARGWSTRVERDCESACTLLLMAGKDRSADPMATVGFHQPDFPGLSASDRAEIIRTNRDDYIKAGVSPAFVDRIMETAPSDMWYPVHADMVDAGVLSAEEVVVGNDRARRERMEETLATMFAADRAAVGQLVDEVTRIDNVSRRGNELSVRYSVLRPLSRSELPAMKRALDRNLRAMLCDSPRARLIEMGASFRFHYVGTKGEEIADVTVRDCDAA